ncbi:Uncharacterized protein C2orf42, partial [Calypte anna]
MDPSSMRTKAPSFLSDLGRATLRGIRKCPRCGTYNGTRGLSCKNKSCGTIFRPASRKAPGAVQRQCQHVRLALDCRVEATPLALKSSVLDAMRVPAETKRSLWQLATEPPGPLVQRVTKNVLVVKCKASQKHSLGYLHASFGQRGGGEGQAAPQQCCSCSCPAGKGGEEEEEEEEGAAPHCIHLLACLCALASDEGLAREFAHVLAQAAGGRVVPQLAGGPGAGEQEGGAAPPKPRKRRRDVVSGDEVLGGVGEGGSHLLLLGGALRERSSLKKSPVCSALRRAGCAQLLDESQVSLSFQDWLASVTERIHQTMHYQFEGKPEPLVFHIPQAFFEALQQRISSGSGKKRLPNTTAAFVRRDALPLGTFSKYTWHITNILQVKQIFDTPELPLEITRSFIQNRDGSYEPFQCPRVEVESIAQAYGHERQPPIRPLELRTFLRVGQWQSPAPPPPT